jgi:hypothetical protein
MHLWCRVPWDRGGRVATTCAWLVGRGFVRSPVQTRAAGPVADVVDDLAGVANLASGKQPVPAPGPPAGADRDPGPVIIAETVCAPAPADSRRHASATPSSSCGTNPNSTRCAHDNPPPPRLPKMSLFNGHACHWISSTRTIVCIPTSTVPAVRGRRARRGRSSIFPVDRVTRVIGWLRGGRGCRVAVGPGWRRRGGLCSR